jgi:diguanylate cyclase (GGDEF)-like protein/PAS domain S-box-containing protein
MSGEVDVINNTRGELELEIARRIHAEEVSRQKQAEFLALAENTADMVARFDRELRHLYVNRAIREATGISPAAFLGKTNRELGMPDELATAWEREIRSVFATGELRTLEFTYPSPKGDIHLEARLVPEYDSNDNIVSVLAITRDVTQCKQIEQLLQKNSFYDPLTGLPNRTLFMDRLGHAFTLERRKKSGLLAVLFIDVDSFKVINDSLGHDAGDRLLVSMTRRFDSCLRSTDTLARLSGDEFAVLLESIKDVAEAIYVAERIQEELRRPFDWQDHELFAAVSIGIALKSTQHHGPADLLRDADNAMHRAKERGRAGYQIFDPAMHTEAVRRLQLETDLRQALEQDKLEVYYQPIVALASHRITGFEALLRWNHPQHGFIPPADFIPIAEATGLILQLDRWVMKQACRQMRAWLDAHDGPAGTPDLTISVNLSSRNFSAIDLVEQIRAILDETRLPGSHLKIEITESTLMEHSASVATTLEQLLELDVQLSMDDFGTGYSSLSYLHRFPLQTLKVDRSFIKQLDEKSEHCEIVRAILSLADTLGIEVVAEGVETHEQMAHLLALDCGYAQGYLFSKPVDSVAAGAMLSSSPTLTPPSVAA